MAPEWFEEWFGEEYVKLYPHRDEAEAERAVDLIVATTGLRLGWRVLDVACGAGRHARAFRAAGARCVGLDLSMTLLRMARETAGVPLVRADMRRLPIRDRSMDLTANLFTSFGYFERDEEQAAALREMTATVRPGGWLVIDFLNPDAVRSGLVPHEIVPLDGREVTIARTVSPDGQFVRKSIRMPSGREYLERVRLYSAEEIAAMLAAEQVVVRHRFGDYAGGPLTTMAPRTILVGQLPDSGGR
jgi:ubiquinone/menaquinone biosynthesis C-methylase UbiE